MLKLRFKQVTYGLEKYLHYKNAKAERKSPLDLKNLCILLEIQQRALGPGESTAGVTYLSVRIYMKSCHIFPKNVAATLLSGSRNGAVGA